MHPSISRVEGGRLRRAAARLPRWAGTTLTALLVGASYYAGSKVGFAIRFPSIPTAIIWPPNSILMAALMLTPARRWWVYLLATLASHLLVQSQTAVPPHTMLLLFATNAGQAALGAYAVRRLCGDGPPQFSRVRDTVVFFAFAVFAAPFVTSFLDAAAVVLTGWGDNFSLVWWARFLSNVLTVLTLVPALIIWVAHGRKWLRRVTLRRFAEGGLLALGLGVAYAFAYSDFSFGPSFAPALLYAPLPFLMWAALRFGAGGVSTSLLAVLLISVFYAIGGRGPFTSQSPAEDVVGLQLFLIAICVPMMLLAAVTEERRRAEVALKESEARNRSIIQAIPDLMFLYRRDGTYLDYYARNQKDLSLTPENFIGKNVSEVLPTDVAESLLKRIRQVDEGSEPQVAEYNFALEGERRWFESRIVLSGENVLNVVRDITDRKRAEQSLEQLTGRLLQLQDEERRRIARELHDTTAQNLLAIVISLETLVRKSSTLPQDFADAVAECQSLCQQTQAELRTLSYLLHPPMLDEAGLILALEWFTEGFSRRSGIRVDFTPPPDFKRLPPRIETALFRVVQESLTNIYRHSGSATAEVCLESGGSQVSLRVTDGGRGMAAGGNGAGPAAERTETLGVGISGMRERLRQLGGCLEVGSNGEGTTVTAVLPLGKGEER